MRVITGTARGRKLETPKGLDTRPTSEMVKEAVMSMVQFEIEGVNFLDLYAGCGQMGIEALSRGAHRCVFVDNSQEACALIRRNLEHTGFLSASLVVNSDAEAWLRTARGPFDIAFIDPPYGKGVAPSFLERISSLIRENGKVFIECDSRESLPEHAGCLRLKKEYQYGKTKIARYEVEGS